MKNGKPYVKIYNLGKRKYKANQRTDSLKKIVVAKLHQMAAIKHLSYTDLYNKAVGFGLNRHLYNNTVVQLETLLEKIKAL